MNAGQARLSITWLTIAVYFLTTVTIYYSNILKAECKSFSITYENISLESAKIAKNKMYTQLAMLE